MPMNRLKLFFAAQDAMLREVAYTDPIPQDEPDLELDVTPEWLRMEFEPDGDDPRAWEQVDF